MAPLSEQERARLARQLKANKLLPLLLKERLEELTSSWLTEEDQDKRERLWAEARALEGFRDNLYAEFGHDYDD